MFAKVAVVVAGLGVLAVAHPSSMRPVVEVAPAVATTALPLPVPAVVVAPAPAPVRVPPTAPPTTLYVAPVPTTLPRVYGPGLHKIGTDLPPGTYTLTESTGCWFELPIETTPDRGSLPWVATYGNVGVGAQIVIPTEAIGFTVLAGPGCVAYQ